MTTQLDPDLANSRGITNPMTLIQAAVERGIDAAQLEKLMDLSERWERNRAAEDFSRAIAGFQSECPVVFKSKTAKGDGDKWQGYQYASYDDVMKEAGPILAKYRIAISFTTESSPAGLTATCRVRVGIHSEETTITLPIPQMKANDTQKFGSALSYAKRYSFCAALNVICSNEDDDAARQIENIDGEDIRAINTLIEEKNVNLDRFLSWAGIERLDLMAKDQLPKALDMLRRKQVQK